MRDEQIRAITEPAVDLSDAEEFARLHTPTFKWPEAMKADLAALLKRVRDAARAEGAEEMDRLRAHLETTRRDREHYAAAFNAACKDLEKERACYDCREYREKAEAALAEARREGAREALEQAAQRVDDWFTVYFSNSPGQKKIDEIKDSIRALGRPEAEHTAKAGTE